MSMFGCLRTHEEEESTNPPKLSDKYEDRVDWQITAVRNNKVRVSYFLREAHSPVFDFVGRVATFRARLPDNEVVGLNSAPIPEWIFSKLTVIKKKNRGEIYTVDFKTDGQDLTPYFTPAALNGYDDYAVGYQVDP